ncbi:MAG: hypothetical protein LLG06_19715 [Desulfobacteraceae bacterium]|nr:hypothetical protein [Desulfobacteraceae bacterium]
MHSKQTTMVELRDGSKADRTKVCFLPVQDSHNPRIYHTSRASYEVDEKGTYRRLGVKPTKKERRQWKRERGHERRAAHAGRI